MSPRARVTPRKGRVPRGETVGRFVAKPSSYHDGEWMIWDTQMNAWVVNDIGFMCYWPSRKSAMGWIRDQRRAARVAGRGR